MEPSPDILQELVRRILKVVQPLRIILFGSAARAEMERDSDLDLLVIMPDGTNRRAVTVSLYRELMSLDVAKDIIVATPADLEKHHDNWSMVYFEALREGKELYHAVA